MHSELTGFGRRGDVPAELRALGAGLIPGRVIAQQRGLWLTAIAGAPEPRLLPARGRLRATPPVTGDWVGIDPGGAIAAVLERRGSLARRAPGDAASVQILAANVDLALLLEPLPDPNERRIERLAALAAANSVPAVLVLTKADLEPDAGLLAPRLGRHLGLADAVALSARDGDGLAILRQLLEPGSTAILLGASGAGKSTLVNTLLGSERQATQPVRSRDGSGRHTTVTRELIALPGGALVVDSPGLRQIALWDAPDGGFADIEELASGCRFADCGHETEPGCAVRDAVDPARVQAWFKLRREQAFLDDRRAAARRREGSGRASLAAARARSRSQAR